MTLRPKPASFESEQCFLSSMMLVPEFLDEFDLKPEEFYQNAHQVIFTGMREIWSKGDALDPVLLAKHLAERGELEQLEVVGGSMSGAAYLASVVEAAPHAAHARFYAKGIRDTYKRRQVIYAALKASGDAYDNESEEVIAELEKELQGIRDVSSAGQTKTMGEAVQQLIELEQNPAAVHATGLADLDQTLSGGVRDGQFVIVGARPGHGKTVLAAQIAAAQQTAIIVY